MEKIKAVLVDDNTSLVEMIKEYFSSNHAGIEVVYTAYDGKEGMKLVKDKQDDYDLIILDLVMPKLDGLGVLEKMNEERAENE